MHIHAELYTSVYDPEKMPNLIAPQLPLAGRSNVGKSSFINCLTERKHLARTSTSPGKTSSINFYWIKSHGFYLVDLPGYGYAKRSKKERKLWSLLIANYFESNQSIQAVIAILDSRLSPQKLDLELINYFRHYNYPIISIMTKADKCKMAQRNRIQQIWRNILGQNKALIMFSSKTGLGKNKVWQILQEFGIRNP